MYLEFNQDSAWISRRYENKKPRISWDERELTCNGFPRPIAVLVSFRSGSSQGQGVMPSDGAVARDRQAGG